MSGVIALRHSGIVVRDLEKCLAFYEGLFNLKAVSRADEDSSFLDIILGGQNIHLTTVKLAAPEGAALLELLDFKEANAAREGGQVNYSSLGPTHVAFTVKDTDELHAAIIRAGGACVSSPQVSPDGKAKVFFARDPEGNLLELVETLDVTS